MGPTAYGQPNRWSVGCTRRALRAKRRQRPVKLNGDDNAFLIFLILILLLLSDQFLAERPARPRPGFFNRIRLDVSRLRFLSAGPEQISAGKDSFTVVLHPSASTYFRAGLHR